MGMIRHIVMWKFKEEAEGADRATNLRKAKALLDALPKRIGEIRDWEVGIDCGYTSASFDLVLVATFADQEGLLAYQQHPEHVKVVEFLRSVHEMKTVVDYER